MKVHLNPTPDRLSHVMAYLDSFLDGIPCGAKARMELEAVLEEAYMNIAAHSGATEADVDLTLAGGEVCLRFSDNGMPFNPLMQPEPDVSLPAAERSIGGLGILMIRRMTDRQAYAFENGRNVLTLMKRIA